MIKLTQKEITKMLKIIGSEGIKEISKEFNVSDDLVRKVINGDRSNNNILIFAVDLAVEKSKKLDKLKKEVKSKIQTI